MQDNLQLVNQWDLSKLFCVDSTAWESLGQNRVRDLWLRVILYYPCYLQYIW